MNGRAGSGLYPGTPSAAGLILFASGSKGGSKPKDVSLVGYVSYLPVSLLIRSSDVSSTSKRPWDLGTKYASQLKWLGPGARVSAALRCDHLRVQMLPTGTQW